MTEHALAMIVFWPWLALTLGMLRWCLRRAKGDSVGGGHLGLVGSSPKRFDSGSSCLGGIPGSTPGTTRLLSVARRERAHE